MNDSTGAASGVTVTWDSNNTWNTGAGNSTADRKLMHGYLDATGQANWETVPYQFYWNENKPEAYVHGLGAWLAAQGSRATRWSYTLTATPILAASANIGSRRAAAREIRTFRIRWAAI